MAVKIAIITFMFTFTVCVLGEFNLTVVHISDFHSHWHEFDENKHDCSKEESTAGKCYGGFARLITFVKDIRKKEKNVLVLSSGEFFLGESLYPLHGWRMARFLLPKLGIDAMSLSNHDFDSGVYELSGFLYAMEFPILCANMIARNTSFLYSRVNKSVILDVNGTKVGIVGYIHRHALKKTRHSISFKFVPEITVLQEEVSRLESEGVDKIIALGHAGYFTDLEIAKKVKGVDIVMGGDSDIMLFDPGHEADELSKIGNIHGNYPRVHHQVPETADDTSLANRTLVLHIPQHGMYVGVLRATFDDNGKIIHERGEPVLLDSSIPQDQATLEYLEYCTGAMEEQKAHRRLPDEAEILGVTRKVLDGNRCRMLECSLGNFLVDAILHEFTFHYRNKSEDRHIAERWGPIDAVVLNAGSILRSVEPGFITIKDILKSVYLGDFFKRIYMSGQQVLDMMEHSVKHYDLSGVTAPGSFLQIAGLKVEYDLSQLPGKRVKSLMIRCRDCGDDKTYYPVLPYKTYVIGMPSFLKYGRDGFYNFNDHDKEDMGQFDVVLIVDYLRRMYEIEPNVDGRIKLYRPNMESNSSFASPLLYGEPASEYNKFEGDLLAPISEQNSEIDSYRKKNNLSSKFSNTMEETPKTYNKNLTQEFLSLINFNDHNNGTLKTEVKNKIQEIHSDSREEDLENDVKTIGLGKIQPFNETHLAEISSNALVETEKLDKAHHEPLSQEKKTFESDMDRLNRRDINENDLATMVKNDGRDDKSSLIKEFLHEISPKNLDKSIKMAETYHGPVMQKIEAFKDGDKDIDKISKSNENNGVKLNHQKSNPGVDIAQASIIKNETRILNGSKISEMLKALLNSTPENLNSSLENVLSKFADFPESSNILRQISHIKNHKKRSVGDWMDGNANIQKYFEFKKNISNFIESLHKRLTNRSQVGNINSVSGEIPHTTAENIEEVFAEFMNHILMFDLFIDLLKNQTAVMNKVNTTASSQTDTR